MTRGKRREGKKEAEIVVDDKNSKKVESDKDNENIQSGEISDGKDNAKRKKMPIKG